MSIVFLFQGCFICMYVYAPCVFLVLTDPEGIGYPGVTLQIEYLGEGAGNSK